MFFFFPPFWLWSVYFYSEHWSGCKIEFRIFSFSDPGNSIFSTRISVRKMTAHATCHAIFARTSPFIVVYLGQTSLIISRMRHRFDWRRRPAALAISVKTNRRWSAHSNGEDRYGRHSDAGESRSLLIAISYIHLKLSALSVRNCTFLFMAIRAKPDQIDRSTIGLCCEYSRLIFLPLDWRCVCVYVCVFSPLSHWKCNKLWNLKAIRIEWYFERSIVDNTPLSQWSVNKIND